MRDLTLTTDELGPGDHFADALIPSLKRQLDKVADRPAFWRDLLNGIFSFAEEDVGPSWPARRCAWWWAARLRGTTRARSSSAAAA